MHEIRIQSMCEYVCVWSLRWLLFLLFMYEILSYVWVNAQTRFKAQVHHGVRRQEPKDMINVLYECVSDMTGHMYEVNKWIYVWKYSKK